MNVIHTSQEERNPKKQQTGKICFFFFASFLAGCLLSGFFFSSVFHAAFLEFKTDTGKIVSLESEKKALLFYYFFLHIRVFFFLVFFAFTNAYKLYSMIFLCYTGLIQGILLTFCIHKDHIFKGLLEYLCFLTPHALLLCPFYLFAFRFLGKTHDTFCLSGTKRKKRELLFKQLPFCLFGIILIFAASFLEAYVNLPLLKKILS